MAPMQTIRGDADHKPEIPQTHRTIAAIADKNRSIAAKRDGGELTISIWYYCRGNSQFFSKSGDAQSVR
jgi:hypothetical protein